MVLSPGGPTPGKKRKKNKDASDGFPGKKMKINTEQSASPASPTPVKKKKLKKQLSDEPSPVETEVTGQGAKPKSGKKKKLHKKQFGELSPSKTEINMETPMEISPAKMKKMDVQTSGDDSTQVSGEKFVNKQVLVKKKKNKKTLGGPSPKQKKNKKFKN